MELNINYKLERFQYLIDTYNDVIIKLIDFSYDKNLLPFKIMISLSYIKSYIKANKIELLEGGIKYLLIYKNEILNFDINNLNELDLDSDNDDNISRKKCMNNIKNVKNDLNLSEKNNESLKNNEILNLIIEIKNKSKNLDKIDIKIIRDYFEILIIILEQIKILYEN